MVNRPRREASFEEWVLTDRSRMRFCVSCIRLGKRIFWRNWGLWNEWAEEETS